MKNMYRRAIAQRRGSDTEASLVLATRWLVYATLGLAIVGLLGFGAAFMQWRALKSTDDRIAQQVDAMQRALNIMTLDQRAWVFLTSLSAQSPLKFTSDALEITFEATLKNVGRTAARKTHIYSGIFLNWFECAPSSPMFSSEACKPTGTGISGTNVDFTKLDMEKFTKDVCDRLSNANKLINIGQNILPNETLPVTLTVKNFASVERSENSKSYIPTLPFCIFYETQDGEIRSTRYIYYIDHTEPSFQNVSMTLDPNRASTPVQLDNIHALSHDAD